MIEWPNLEEHEKGFRVFEVPVPGGTAFEVRQDEDGTVRGAIVNREHQIVGASRNVVERPLPAIAFERELLGQLQSQCRDFGAVYCVHQGWNLGKGQDEIRRKLTRLRHDNSRMFDNFSVKNGHSFDGVFSVARNYEMRGGVLYKRVYDFRCAGNRLCCCAPTGSLKAYQSLRGAKCLEFRNELLLEYHNGPLGHHKGRDSTLEALSENWHWPGMPESVRRWCSSCTKCQEEAGKTAVQAWTRTSLYSHPFRALQMDTVTVPLRAGDQYLLTVICLFSRWCWAIPLQSRTAQEIATALLHHVIGPYQIYPVVLRSDNAQEFLSPTIRYLNRRLEIAHITGATYHPQSQGTVERLHRKINDIFRKLMEKPRPDAQEDWHLWLPFVVGFLRTQKMKALGNRSPMEVVMGIQPDLPASLRAGLPVEAVGAE